MPRILIVDDEPEMVRGLEDNFRFEGYEPLSATNGGDGLAMALREAPDLIVLDVMMPQMSGWDVLRALRQKGLDIPVIMLTARGEEADRVIGLELGADDYLTKPFSVREIVARVKALLRRTGREPAQPEPERALSIGPLHIDPSTYRVQKNGENVPLTALEFRLLYFLAARPDRVFTRDQLLDAVWGTERFVTPRSVDVYIRRLREKIEENPMKPVFLKTLRGAGYSFEGPR
jgi:DNA-binding response OmpR family regulator